MSTVFKQCQVIWYNKKDLQFKVEGVIVEVSEAALKEIFKGNFVYVPFCKLVKTHLDKSNYKEVGAIIVGAQDKKLNKGLWFMYMRNLIADYKKSELNYIFH